jgi:hypothetical protein
MEVTMQRRLFWIVVIVLALATVRWTYAQVIAVKPVTPTVLTGGDIGFRVEGDRAGTPVGEIVVKINGQWVAADVSPTGLPQKISAR